MVDLELGEKITFYRKNKHISQEKFAELLNVSRQTVYKWEASLNKPKIDKLQEIITLFEISYDDLLGN